MADVFWAAPSGERVGEGSRECGERGRGWGGVARFKSLPNHASDL